MCKKDCTLLEDPDVDSYGMDSAFLIFFFFDSAHQALILEDL